MVLCGIDRVTEPPYASLFRGRRLGVVSNMSGLSVVHGWKSPLDVMHQLYHVTALFAPEHGTRGVLGPGETVSSGRDELTGLWSYSLFEDMVFAVGPSDSAKDAVYTPAEEALHAVDLMVFDLQDVGSRYFTYASTLFYTMKACAKAHCPLCVLDRPNPLGGIITEGQPQHPDCSSFIGLARMPIRHALTIGELALYFNRAYALDCELTVLPMAGWTRDMMWADTGLPFVKPSPNLPSLDAITVYNGTCMLAGTNVSEGRGTTTPFTTVGAPYIRPDALADAMNDLHLPGLSFSPAFFIPAFSKYAGQVCRGVYIHVTDPHAVRAVSLGVHLLNLIRHMFPEDFRFTPPPDGARWHIDLSTGSSCLREGSLSASDLLTLWTQDAQAFQEESRTYHLYPIHGKEPCL